MKGETFFAVLRTKGEPALAEAVSLGTGTHGMTVHEVLAPVENGETIVWRLSIVPGDGSGTPRGWFRTPRAAVLHETTLIQGAIAEHQKAIAALNALLTAHPPADPR